jgi:hypothetical protein
MYERSAKYEGSKSAEAILASSQDSNNLTSPKHKSHPLTHSHCTFFLLYGQGNWLVLVVEA